MGYVTNDFQKTSFIGTVVGVSVHIYFSILCNVPVAGQRGFLSGDRQVVFSEWICVTI